MSLSDTTTPDPSNPPAGAADAATAPLSGVPGSTPLPGAPGPAPMAVGAAEVPPAGAPRPGTPDKTRNAIIAGGIGLAVGFGLLGFGAGYVVGDSGSSQTTQQSPFGGGGQMPGGNMNGGTNGGGMGQMPGNGQVPGGNMNGGNMNGGGMSGGGMGQMPGMGNGQMPGQGQNGQTPSTTTPSQSDGQTQTS
ncbi:hypothetical protein [Gordonia sp. NPDC003376]